LTEQPESLGPKRTSIEQAIERLLERGDLPTDTHERLRAIRTEIEEARRQEDP
jgi:hypothetical protein